MICTSKPINIHNNVNYIDEIHFSDPTENMTPVAAKTGTAVHLSREMPPFNGFGSEEDSLCSCKGLLPKPPKKDFIKFMEKDRRGLDSNVLRFLARMDTKKPIDMDRRFIISYYLSDDTVLVFEPPVRNSGLFESCMYFQQRLIYLLIWT